MQRMNEWPVFSIFRHRASCQSVTWSTPCLPSSQVQAEPWLASVRWESMGGPERGHVCYAEQKRTWTSYSAEGTVTIFLAAKAHKWMFRQYSKLKPELISSPTFNGGFFPTLIHHFVPPVASSPQSDYSLHSLPHPLRLPQTCAHRVSSNLAACPWVHTVAKAHFSSFFWHFSLALMAKLWNLLQLEFLCPHRMHCHCNKLVNNPYNLLLLLLCFSISLRSSSGNPFIRLPYRHCSAVFTQILPYSPICGVTSMLTVKSSASDVSWIAEERPIDTRSWSFFFTLSLETL